jgi:hypothetical protein
MPNNSFTLYAKWEGQIVNVTMSKNITPGTDPTYTGTARVGQTITLSYSNIPGYYFTGWTKLVGANSISGNSYTISPNDVASGISLELITRLIL